MVEKEALSHNIELLQKMANGVPIWAVLKGNGYGIGVLPLARHLAEAGIDHFCVTEVREAELLRENGFEDDSILTPLPPMMMVSRFRRCFRLS